MAISLLVPCGVIAMTSIPLILAVVPPNSVYGFRTPRTLADRELWFRANRFAGGALFVASVTSAVVFALRPEYASGRSSVGLLVFLVPLFAAVVASFGYVRRVGGGSKR